MQLDCDYSKAFGYSSKSQISRVLSEEWMCNNGYCLSCDSDHLMPTVANTKASDFFCKGCNQNYELKTFSKRPSRRLVDGAYAAMISRIQEGSVPVLLLLERNELWQIRNLTAIHHMFLTSEVIEKRKPLSLSARRAGWVGCNIRLDRIAVDAQIQVVHDGLPSSPHTVRETFQRFNSLQSISPRVRGWVTLTLWVLRSLNLNSFSLSDLYAQESLFSKYYPNNNNIRAKVRQQLQVLRDLGYVEFYGNGAYKMLI